MKAVDLFSGCGGMSLGFQNAGVDVVMAYDNWTPAVEIYRKNFKHPIHSLDLNSKAALDEIRALSPDLIIGGPPCQDFSIAGDRNMGARANLTIRYAKIVSDVQPEWFVMENVYNIERMPILPKAIKILKKAGYGITKIVLDASLCGCPQKRNRFFLIGHMGDKDDFLHENLTSNLAAKPMTVRDYLGNLLKTQYYYMHPRSYNRRAVYSVDEPSATIRGVNRPIPENYTRHSGDKADITDGVRALTTKERSYIQTFPKSFVWVGNKTAVEQAIGNAVPVKLAEYVATQLIAYSTTQKD